MNAPSLLRRVALIELPAALVTLATIAATGADATAQTLADLSFGTEDTFDVVTWNIERFPKNGELTSDAVKDVLQALDADVYALQEIDEPDVLQEIVDALPGYEAFYESSFYAGLVYVYNSQTIQVQSIYEIYTTFPFWSPFPRSPVVMELTYNGEELVVINNHFKCCGDGFLDLSDEDDEEFRRWTASNLLESYIAANHPDTRVILTGDLNDLLTDSPSNNVFQSFLDAPASYSFVDLAIAQGSSSGWSFPNWPSHLDHILITDELFGEFGAVGGAVETILVEDYLPGGWPQYDSTLSDHRPVGIRIPVGDTGPSCPEQFASSELARFGVPPNPLVFIPTPGAPPVLGQVWAPQVFHAAFQPAATLDLGFVTTGVINLPTSMGTVLCDLGTDTFLFPNAPGQPFSIPIPDDCTLAGVPLYAQVASVAGDNVQLTNGLDIVIGTP